MVNLHLPFASRRNGVQAPVNEHAKAVGFELCQSARVHRLGVTGSCVLLLSGSGTQRSSQCQYQKEKPNIPQTFHVDSL